MALTARIVTPEAVCIHGFWVKKFSSLHIFLFSSVVFLAAQCLLNHVYIPDTVPCNCIPAFHPSSFLAHPVWPKTICIPLLYSSLVPYFALPLTGTFLKIASHCTMCGCSQVFVINLTQLWCYFTQLCITTSTQSTLYIKVWLIGNFLLLAAYLLLKLLWKFPDDYLFLAVTISFFCSYINLVPTPPF